MLVVSLMQFQWSSNFLSVAIDMYMIFMLSIVFQIVVWYFFQICAGMAHVHEFGVVHR